MAKRRASSSLQPDYDSDEINVAHGRSIPQKTQKTSHETNSPPLRRTRWLECVLIPAPTQQESASLLEAITTTSVEPSAELSKPAVINHEETELPAYERPLILDGKRPRKSTYKGLTISDFFHSVPRADEVQPQAARDSRSARKSTGQNDHGPLHALLASSSAQTAQQPPNKSSAQPAQLPSPEASTETEQCSEDVSRSSSRRPRRSAVRRSYVPEVLEDSEDELVTSAPAPRKRGQVAPSEAESDFEEEEAQEEGSQEEEFTEDEIVQSEDSASEELSSEGGYDSGLDKKNSSKHRNKASEKSTAAKPKPTSSQASALRGGISKTGKQTGKSTAKEMHILLNRGPGEPKGLNTELPPLSSISDIFKDITAKALSLGLREALKTNPIPLRVATMCSGTESPLLALEMVQDSLRSLGASELSIEHLFSAEIVPYKQAYIERNFNPPIIYRDITEITSAIDMEVPAATTVYGSKVPIPGNVHILIAGTSCVDFSRLNKNRKDLDQETGGESSKTWFGVLAYVKVFRPAIVILENVLHGPWDRMMECYRQIGYEVGGVLLDTKNYYLPHTRQRGYLVCFDKSKAEGNIGGIGKKWESTMADFRRHASSSAADFMLPDEVRTQQQSSLDDSSKEYDWAACEIRHLQYRQDKRLGNARPFTFWSESGTMNVPETGSISWYHKQPERVRDYLDISLLRKAPVFDVRYKMRIWDVSQNVDMFTDGTQFGITPCITPSGLFFASDTGRALAPQELLSLQGLPLSKISFTTETVSEIQDLAGNAMSTTAVGPAILSALICGQAVLHNNTSLKTVGSASDKTAPLLQTLVDVTTQVVSSATETQELDLSDLLDHSARRCFCEGSAGIAKQAIQQCTDCRHTTCKRCGGNPAHNYRLAASINRERSDPVEFERNLRSRLPQCLAFNASTTLDSTELAHDGDYSEASNVALNSTFNFSQVKRSHCWTAIYEAPAARLELRLDENRASWHLFGKPDKTLPANSKLRTLLEQPIAVADCEGSLLGGLQWRQRALCEDKFEVQLEGTQPIASWLARLGLPDYRGQQVWSRIHIKIPAAVATNVGVDLNGLYEALPLCGTAGDSLYKKVGTAMDRPIYLLHNPTRNGDPKLDRFVFTTEKERLDFGERPVLASLDPKWSPCIEGEAFGRTSLQSTGKWQNLGLQLYEVDPKVTVHAPVSIEAAQLQLDCKEAELILKCDFTSSGRDEVDGTAHVIDPKDNRFFAQHAYVFELMRRQLPNTQWRPLPFALSSCDCSSCAPRKPNLRWKLIAKTIKPYEDPASAAVYERAIKSRPPPILFQFVHEARGSTMHFGINLASLAHRAVARLPANSRKTSRLSWNLEQDLASSSNFTFRPFVLKPTEGPSSPNADVGMSCRLFPKQALVLHWMQQQEAGRSFTIEEAEEAIVPALGWRAEVRAETDVKVCGGICADHPGFGKTITSLALIHSHLSSGTNIIADLRTRQTTEDGTKGLIATQATLIVAPITLIKQWASEIRDKLGYTQGVLTVTAQKDLDRYTIPDFEKAKIVIVSRAVLNNPLYAERIANFAAMPGPTTQSGRAFSQWLSHASKAIPAHLEILLNKNKGLKHLQEHVKSKYAERVESDDFRAVVPSRRLVGKDYVESKGKSKSELKAASKVIPVGGIGRPLFEHFFWNRIIVDEFHQYESRELALLKALRADKRWGLSGTPAMTDFYDIAQIADLLNIPLRFGSNSTRVMAARNVRTLQKELSDFEKFDLLRATPSDCMHARIHEIAQSFLEAFVRRNVMDFDEMAYDDNLVPVTLDVDHQAAYTELSQQLASQEMKIRKVKNSKTTTRDQRFMAAIKDVQTAEEALSRDASFFERQGSLQTGLAYMIQTRQSEIDKTLADLEAACFAAQHEVSGHNEALEKTAKSLLEDGTLGDDETISLVRDIIQSTARPNTAAPQKSKTSKKKKGKAADDSDAEGEDAGRKESKDTAKGRELTAKVNALAKGFLTSIRSKRYINNVERIRNVSTRPEKCDSQQCSGADNNTDAQVAVSALCGHRVCKKCYLRSKEQHSTDCAATGCSAAQYDHHLLWSHILDQTSKASPYGAKLDAAIQLLSTIREQGEKAILFMQYSEQLEQAEAALQNANIPATVVTSGSVAGDQIATFCADRSTDTVLVLNASDETAAGSNIQAANHVIFLSPLLRDSQYGYDSTMAQAIGRVRRHGQKRPIHVYRVCALHTIDVDILEHREHRAEAMMELGASVVTPPHAETAMDIDQGEHHSLAKPQRVQLVRENGSFSLRPKSWLYRDDFDDSDEQKIERVEGRDRAGWEDFSSQVKFSRALAGNE